jgi:uncharacterized protein (TIGR02118 family)
MKLIALYKQPVDPSAFDRAYFNTHLPLLSKVPGLKKTVVTRFTRNLSGEAFYLMAEMYFTDKDALRAAMKSPEMISAGENLNSFAEGLVSMFYGEEEPASDPAAGAAVSATAA